MALDAYSSCPCGSGKKFKWCCQPIHVEIDKAFRQDAEGQHEAALRTMDQVIAEHPANPEALGRKAQLLYQNDRVEDAEETLQKAFEINPDYPFGHLLRGLFRQHEGEVAGALLLFRKAAELYDPDAKDILAQVYSLIADCEMKLNRPVAARAALKISLHYRPNEELRQGFDALFGDKSHLPASARREYTFQRASQSSSPERLAAWQRALERASTGKLIDVLRAFEQLATDNPEDASAWYDLALARAWLGDNAHALEALDRYVTLQPEEGRAASAWALAEVLRFGQGMEDQADYVEHSVFLQIRDPQHFFGFFQEWERERRLTGVQVRQEEGVVTGIILDKVTALTAESAAAQLPRLGAYFLLVGDMVRLWNIDAEAVERSASELQQRAGGLAPGQQRKRGPAHFADVWTEALVFPVGITDQAEAEQRIRSYVERFFEDTWIHRPLKALNGVPPVDAAGHPVLRKKLLGVIQFIEECGAGSVQPYDFNQLRRKLGLMAGGQVPEAAAAGAPPDIAGMGASELAALAPESLTDDQAETAYQAAVKLDAHELAGRFARNLVSRQPRPERPDRFPWYAYLAQRALAEGNSEMALQYLGEGQKTDLEHNEGRRQNDYDLRRGLVLAKRGETTTAQEVFERLIERVPAELKFRASAAEAMLSARQGATALRFAEQGLAEARKKNDRDSEEHFKELVSAAKRQSG